MTKLVSAAEDDSVENWGKPIRYIGVDVQYFAALIIPRNQDKDKYFELARPVIVNNDGGAGRTSSRNNPTGAFGSNQSRIPSPSRITGIRSCSDETVSFAPVVNTVKVCSRSPVSGATHDAQSPAVGLAKGGQAKALAKSIRGHGASRLTLCTALARGAGAFRPVGGSCLRTA